MKMGHGQEPPRKAAFYLLYVLHSVIDAAVDDCVLVTI